MVACELRADRLVILTNVGGLYDRAIGSPPSEIDFLFIKITPALIRRTQGGEHLHGGEGEAWLQNF